MEEQNTKPKRNRKQQSITKMIRNNKIVDLALEGTRTQKEIAAEVKVDRTTVGRVLSSEEVKKILKAADSRVNEMIHTALDTVKTAMTTSHADMTNGLKASLAVLKSVGVLKDKVDLTHSFPKPTIIEKLNGDRVILGSRPVDQDESDEDYVA
jgi:hypothetical protein